jgi:predicted nucleic acid-binding protein
VYDVLHINEATSLKSVQLIEAYKLSHGLSIPDATIGAMAVVHQLELYTYNHKDFYFIPDIRLYSPQ